MSADSGIYILETPTVNGSTEKEFRIVHATAIDNLDYEVPVGSDLNPEEVIKYFGRSSVFSNSTDAMTKAKTIYDEIMSSPYPVIEYGISFIKGRFPFSEYKRLAAFHRGENIE